MSLTRHAMELAGRGEGAPPLGPLLKYWLPHTEAGCCGHSRRIVYPPLCVSGFFTCDPSECSASACCGSFVWPVLAVASRPSRHILSGSERLRSPVACCAQLEMQLGSGTLRSPCRPRRVINLGTRCEDSDLCSKCGACVEVARGCSLLLLALFIMRLAAVLYSLMLHA